MRWDWLPLSASALVIGVLSLVVGALLNPLEPGSDADQSVLVAAENGGRFLGMAVLFFLSSVAMTLGLPSVLSLFAIRGRRTGLAAVGVFAIGAIGLSGYAMLLVFFRALVREDAVRPGSMEAVTSDLGFELFLYGWVATFYLGLLLMAAALLLARRTPVWVPVLLVAYVAAFPLAEHIGRVGQTVQMMALAFAFTGIAMEAVHPRVERHESTTQAAY